MNGYEFLNIIYKDLYLLYNGNLSLTPPEKIRKYLEKLQRVVSKTIETDRKEKIKNLLIDRYVMRDIPEEYFKKREKLLLARGDSDEYCYFERLQDRINVIMDQEESLRKFIDFFLSTEMQKYPDWLLYWAFVGITSIGSYDGKNNKFTRRTTKTTNPFVEFDRDVIKAVINLMQEYAEGKFTGNDTEALLLLQNGSFRKLYEFCYKNIMYHRSFDLYERNVYKPNGKWMLYEGADDVDFLMQDLEGKGTNWCVLNKNMAANILKEGQFYVYYAKDVKKYFSLPKISIRVVNNCIVEVRGTTGNQEVAEEFLDTLNFKLRDFKNYSEYSMYFHDKSIIDKIYEKHLNKEDLDKEEIRFLHEVRRKLKFINGKPDERVYEIIKDRDSKKDLAYALSCTEDEITFNEEELLSGKKIKFFKTYGWPIKVSAGFIAPYYFHGNLIYDENVDYKTVTFPKVIVGDLTLNLNKSFKDFLLPEEISGKLILIGAKIENEIEILRDYNSVEFKNCNFESELDLSIYNDINFTFDNVSCKEKIKLNYAMESALEFKNISDMSIFELPKYVENEMIFKDENNLKDFPLPTETRDLYFSKIKYDNKLVFPEDYKGNITFNNKVDLKNIVFPKILRGSLSITYPNDFEGVILPEIIEQELRIEYPQNLEKGTLTKEVHGGIKISGIKSLSNITVPIGTNYFYSFPDLEELNDFTFHKSFKGYINLENVKVINNITLPQKLGGYLKLNKIKTLKYYNLPIDINGSLYLNSVEYLEDNSLPEKLNGSLFLTNIKNIDNIPLPSGICYYLDLSSLTETKYLKIPDDFTGICYLSSLKSASNLEVSSRFKGGLYMKRCIDIENFKMPNEVWGDLILSSLEHGNNKRMPKFIDGILDINMLSSLSEFVWPEDFKFTNCVKYKDKYYYSVEEFKNLIASEKNNLQLVL